MEEEEMNLVEPPVRKGMSTGKFAWEIKHGGEILVEVHNTTRYNLITRFIHHSSGALTVIIEEPQETSN